jgi:hypothetical protein
MTPFVFRAPRIETDLPMQVGLQEIDTGKLIPGRLNTTAINFSEEGACLVFRTLSVNGKHFFFTTLNSDSYNLVLCPEKQDGSNGEFIIAARSLWMDSCEFENRSGFKIGVQFLQKQKEFFKQLQG